MTPAHARNAVALASILQPVTQHHHPMNSLAYKPKKSSSNIDPAMPSPTGGENRTSYPRLRMNGPQAQSAKLTKCAIGDEYEITMRVKAVRLGGDEWEKTEGGTPAEFDVISASDPKPVSSEDESEAEDKPKTKGGRVKSPKEAVRGAEYEEGDED